LEPSKSRFEQRKPSGKPSGFTEKNDLAHEILASRTE
jgi:hypothetical protein